MGIFLFFFLSGLSALVFEVAWVRQLGLILGNTAQATGIVLAVFLGGLALGAYLGGKLADKLRPSPLVAYGILEFGVGLLALFVSWALRSTDLAYVWLHHHLLPGGPGVFIARLLISAGLILMPTLLMGATLPVLVRYLEERKLSSKMFSLLYGLNTLGAAMGGLAACFVGFTYLGIQNTLCVAAGINLLVGLLAAGLGRSAAGGIEISEADGQTAPERSPDASGHGSAGLTGKLPGMSLRLLSGLAFLTGFTSLGYEVLWTRILRCYMTSMTYSFTIMISMFLLGLAIGSLLHETCIRRAVRGKNRPLLFFYGAQFLAALLCAISLPIFPALSAGLLKFDFHSLLSKYFFFVTAVSVPTICLPSIFIGLLFPMIGSLAADRDDHAASAVGRVYAVNTIGCVCGSLVAGFVLVPTVGSVLGFKLTVGLSVMTVIVAAYGARGISSGRRRLMAGVPAALFLLYMAVHFQPTSLLPGARVLTVKEDSVAGMMRLLDHPEINAVTLELNGASMASNALPNLRYMRTLAFLPILLNPHPEKVLVGCFGTGTTAGAAAICPSVKHVDVVELSQMVFDAAPFFHKTNYDILRNPKVAAHVNDVRNFLLTTDNTYDVVTFEPPPPQFAGTVNLYTREFYQLAARHLDQDGLVCQWAPFNQVPAAVWKMMLASARSVFPYVSVWVSNNQEAVFLASMHEPAVNFAEVQRRIADAGGARAGLREIGYDDASSLLCTYLISGDALDQFIKDSPPVTDDRPTLEFFLPFAGPTVEELDLEARGRPQLIQLAKSDPDPAQFWRNWVAVHLLRTVFDSDGRSREQANRAILEAVRLLPDNRWMRFVGMHPQAAYPRRATAITR